MIFTWIKYGKPDVSMCLNASLAGLVAITAGCDVVDAFGSAIIGIVAGLLVCFGVWLLDHVLHVDDPVGAVAVHCLNGLWGSLAVGLFATTSVPDNDTYNGLFYGGGFTVLGVQALGVVCILAWTSVMIALTSSSSKRPSVCVFPQKKKFWVWTQPNTTCLPLMQTSCRLPFPWHRMPLTQQQPA